MKNDCAFRVPHEFTGIGSVCALLKSSCNELGKRCLAYRKQTAEGKRMLKEAIARMSNQKENNK